MMNQSRIYTARLPRSLAKAGLLAMTTQKTFNAFVLDKESKSNEAARL
jgi:hypothetical protein